MLFLGKVYIMSSGNWGEKTFFWKVFKADVKMPDGFTGSRKLYCCGLGSLKDTFHDDVADRYDIM